MPKFEPATDSATELRSRIGDDATANFEDDPKFVDSNPTGNASTENVTVQRDTDDTEDSDDEFEDDDELEDEDEDEDEDDDEDEDEDEDDDDEDDADEVTASPAFHAADSLGNEESEEDDDEGDIDTGIDEDDLEDDDMDTDQVAAATWTASNGGTLSQHLSI